MENKKRYLCRKLFLYNFLTSKGFVPVKVVPDKYDVKKTCWLYNDSIELRNAVEEYYNVKC